MTAGLCAAGANSYTDWALASPLTTRAPVLPNWSQGPLLGLAGATLAVALLAGGSSQPAMISTATAELFSLPLLGFALWLATGGGLGRARWPAAILAAGVAIGAAQLVTLPVAVWRILPGRAAALADMVAAGSAPRFLAVSLDPGATARALAALSPAIAIFLGVAVLGGAARRRLIWLVLALGVLSAFIGIAQATGRMSSFYAVTNPGFAVGFFANRNHFAALMYALLPMAAAMAAPVRSGEDGQGRWRTGALIAAAAMAGVYLLALAACRSRAGMALGVVALIGAWAVFRVGRGGGRRTGGWAPGLIIVAAIVAFSLLQFTRVGLLASGRSLPLDEGRGAFTMTTLHASAHYAPLGAGLGAFVPAYEASEPVSTLTSEYINHAHDDWAELWLDGGVPMAAVVAAFLAWLVMAARRAWSRATDVASALPGRAGSIVVGLLLVHSTVDYPLRTAAMSALFALACALMVPPPDLAPATRRRSRNAQSRPPEHLRRPARV